MKFAIITNDLQVAAANKHKERKMAVDSFLPRQIDLLNKLRKMGVHIFHLQLINEEWDPRIDYSQPPERRFTRWSSWVEMLKEILGEGDMIIEKTKDSGFYNTILDTELNKLGVESIIISWMQSHICVQTTAADAYFRGYWVLVPKEAVVSTRKEDTEAALKWLENYCAKVLSNDEIIEEIQSSLILS